jgi:hypothetical protein
VLLELGAPIVALACVVASARRLAWAVAPIDLEPRAVLKALEGDRADEVVRSLRAALGSGDRFAWERDVFAAFDEADERARDASNWPALQCDWTVQKGPLSGHERAIPIARSHPLRPLTRPRRVAPSNALTPQNQQVNGTFLRAAQPGGRPHKRRHYRGMPSAPARLETSKDVRSIFYAKVGRSAGRPARWRAGPRREGHSSSESAVHDRRR